MSEEEAGRYARYACFREALAEWHGDKVAVAHNRNDNAETVLFHLFRGSGLKGLSGMEPLSRLPGDGEDGRRILVRPLLFVSRGEIEDYLRKRSVSFCQDSTNGSEAYSRNRIRRRILPQAELVNKEAVSHIVQAASMIGEIDEWLEKEAFRWINMYCHHGKNGVSIPCIQFEELAREQKGRILRMVIGQLLGSLKDITKRHTDSVLELSAKQSGRSFDLPGGLKAERGYEKLWIGFKEKEQQEKGIVILEPSEEEKAAGLFGYCFRYQRKCRDENEKIPENRYTKWFDYDKIENSLCLRGRRPGDYFQAFSDGRSQTVKSYMINEKIPTEDRDRIPLLADGSHILWIISGRISEAYKVTEDTSRILVVEVLPECKITD